MNSALLRIPLAPERANTHRQFKHTITNSALVCCVQCARREPHLTALEQQIEFCLLLLNQQIQDCQNTRLGQYPRKNLWLCLK